MVRAVAFSLLVVLAALAGCGKKTDTPTAADGGAPPRTDKDRLQGVWAVESIDLGDPKLNAKVKELTKVRVQFRGDRIGTGPSGAIREDKSFALDESADPKVMAVTHLGADGKPMPPPFPDSTYKAFPHEWLYKFDGDVLVLAQIDFAVFTEKAPERPTGFTPRPHKPGTPGVTIVRLKKTDEAATEPAPRPAPARGTRR